MKNPTQAERKSDRELVVTRTFNAPARLVFDAWTKPELFRKWWAPKSFGLDMISCELDVRVGGGYRLVFAVGPEKKEMAFFGKYLEVVPNARIVWTNEEDPDASVTTVTFEEQGGKTVLVMSDVFPSKKACDDAIASGSTSGTCETMDQLGELLGTLNQRS